MNNKTVFVMLILCVIGLNSLFCETAAEIPVGSGTQADPYQIANLGNLRWLSESYDDFFDPVWWDNYFVQTAYIDASETAQWNSGEGFSPIGGKNLIMFTSSYDGQGHTIDGLTINKDDNYLGLFGRCVDAEIKNLHLRNVNISSAETTQGIFVGGLVGELFQTTITNCSVTGAVSGLSNIGGLVGFSTSETGIPYAVNPSKITNCYSYCNITQTGSTPSYSKTGVFAGYIGEATQVKNCFAHGNINAHRISGGFVGASQGINAENCFAITNINNHNNSDYVGGFIGWPKNCETFTDTVYNSVFKNCFAICNVSESHNSAGFNAAVINGGVDINNSYAVSTLVGNIVRGFSYRDLPGGGSITNSFWDTTVSGILDSDGGTGKTTLEMKNIDTYTDITTPGLDAPWDFTGDPNDDTGSDDIWTLDYNSPAEGYPFLNTHLPDVIEHTYYIDENRPQGSVIDYAEAFGYINHFEILGAKADSPFAVDETSGKIFVNNSELLNFELNSSVTFTLRGSYESAKGLYAYDDAEITVNISNIDEPPQASNTNVPGYDGSNPGVIYLNSEETILYFFNGFDPEGGSVFYEWYVNGELKGTGSSFKFDSSDYINKDKSGGEFEVSLNVSDGTHSSTYSWILMVLNTDNPITVSSVTPAPNTSTDPSISTAGGSYNMTEGETLNFSVDADDIDGSLLWRNWYVNDELFWLDPDFDFNTHFMSSGGSPYDIKLYLQGQQGDYQEFHWTVNVSNKEAVTYANSPMILNGTAMIEGLNAESGDAIAAYSGDELRGETLLNGSNFDNFIINLSENNEEISFVIYDSDNNIIKTVHRTISGEINTAQEITLHGYEEVSNSFVLAENWNYVSFNTIPEDNSVSSVFTNINVSQIQTVDEVYSSSNPEFLNTLKEIKPGIGYLVKMNSNSSIFVNGYSAENSEIQLYEGWNLIGYTERSSADIETAFGSIMDKIIEIKSEASVYSADMPAYMNTLSYIEENKAYWVKCSEACVLDFPRIEDKRHNSSYLENQDFNKVTSSFSAEGNGLRDTRSTSPTRPPVSASFGSIAVKTNSFVIYAEISNPSDKTLCAYSNNELRGFSLIVENNNKYYTSIVVNSDIAGEEITLKIGDKTIKTISSIPGTTIGKDNLLQLDGSLENEIPASFKVNLFPNPFNPEINISFELPKAERINISVFDINGKLVKTLEDNVFNSGKHSITWNGTDSNNNKMASGIYFVKVKSDSYNTTEKIVMLK